MHARTVNSSGIPTAYPRQLEAGEILPEARVLAVADMLEAMGTYRPYRPALGLEFAINEIKSEAGTKLDSEVVTAACSLMEDGKLRELLHR